MGSPTLTLSSSTLPPPSVPTTTIPAKNLSSLLPHHGVAVAVPPQIAFQHHQDYAPKSTHQQQQRQQNHRHTSTIQLNMIHPQPATTMNPPPETTTGRKIHEFAIDLDDDDDCFDDVEFGDGIVVIETHNTIKRDKGQSQQRGSSTHSWRAAPNSMGVLVSVGLAFVLVAAAVVLLLLLSIMGTVHSNSSMADRATAAESGGAAPGIDALLSQSAMTSAKNNTSNSSNCNNSSISSSVSTPAMNRTHRWLE